MKKLLVLALGLAGMLVSSCSDSETTDEPGIVKPEGGDEGGTTKPSASLVFSANELNAAKATNGFSYNFFNAVSNTLPKNENVVVSPLSAQILLSMIANSTDEAATREITDALGCNDLDALNSLSNKYLTELPQADEDVKMALANSVWYDKKYTLNPNFAAALTGNFNTTPFARDFNQRQTVVDEINRWCADNTNNLIDRIINGLPAQAVAVLANALYFKDNWQSPFEEEKTVDGKFNGIDGQSDAKLMFRSEGLGYIEGIGYQAVRLPLRGKYATWFVLPAENTTVDNLMQGFDINGLTQCKFEMVDLTLPKFKYQSDEMDLLAALADLGVKSAFDLNNRQLFTVPVNGSSNVLQKTTVSFDENGTEASAVTAEIPELSPGPGDEPVEVKKKVVRIDRPFMFFMIEERTGACLMAGKIVKI